MSCSVQTPPTSSNRSNPWPRDTSRMFEAASESPKAARSPRVLVESASVQSACYWPSWGRALADSAAGALARRVRWHLLRVQHVTTDGLQPLREGLHNLIAFSAEALHWTAWARETNWRGGQRGRHSQ